jgi:hypothetical protein
MVVPSFADRFRAAVSTLQSLDGKEGMSFHTFTLQEDRCVRLLVKNLGRGIPESVVWEELESLNIRVQGVTQNLPAFILWLMVGRVVIAMVNFYSEFSPGQDVFEKL